MSVTVYHNQSINNYIILINCLLKDAKREVLDDVRIKQIREAGKTLIRQINNDKQITDEMRMILPFITEFQLLVDFVNRKIYASPYEEGYFVH